MNRFKPGDKVWADLGRWQSCDIRREQHLQPIEYAAMIVGLMPTPNDAGPVGAVSQWYEVDIFGATNTVGMYTGLRPRDGDEYPIDDSTNNVNSKTKWEHCPWRPEPITIEDIS